MAERRLHTNIKDLRAAQVALRRMAWSAWQSYTPIITVGGTAETVESQDGHFMHNDMLCTLVLRTQFGGALSNTGILSWSTPINGIQASTGFVQGSGYAYDQTIGLYSGCIPYLASASTIQFISVHATASASGIGDHISPFTWADDDHIQLCITYPVAVPNR